MDIEMISSQQAMELHARRCLGEELMPSEMHLLEQWYLEQDAAERANFRENSEIAEDELVHQIDASRHRIELLRKRANELEEANGRMEAEIRELTGVAGTSHVTR